MNCISLSFCQHCSCTPAQIVRTRPLAVTSALVQVFSKRVISTVSNRNSHSTSVGWLVGGLVGWLCGCGCDCGCGCVWFCGGFVVDLVEFGCVRAALVDMEGQRNIRRADCESLFSHLVSPNTKQVDNARRSTCRLRSKTTAMNAAMVPREIFFAGWTHLRCCQPV